MDFLATDSAAIRARSKKLHSELAKRAGYLGVDIWWVLPDGMIHRRPTTADSDLADAVIQAFAANANSKSLAIDSPKRHLFRFEDRLGSQCNSIFVAAVKMQDDRPAEAIGESLRCTFDDLMRNEADNRTLFQLMERLEQSYEENHVFFRMAKLLNSLESPSKSVAELMTQIHDVMPFEWVALRFCENACSLQTLRREFFAQGTLPVDSAAMASHADAMVNSASSTPWVQMHAPESSAIAMLCGTEILAEPVRDDGQLIGVLLAGNKTGEDAALSSFETQFVRACADFIGVFHQNAARFAEQQAMFLGTLGALTAAIDAKDPYTRGHSERVALLAATMARAMHMPAQDIEQYRIAGLVHDVGKIGVPEAVLRKPGRLTDEEFEQIKLHPSIGHTILQGIPSLQPMLPGVRHHHEQWCGRGYPDQLAGEQIPLVARVLALADTFDAMSSTRSYRAALTREFVLSELQKCAGQQYDPALVPTFVALDFAEFDQMLTGHQTLAAHQAA